MQSNVVLDFIQSFFGSAGLIVGLFALVGSILLRRSVLKTIASTFTTILGFFILSVGGGAIGTAMTDFGGMFKIVIGSTGSGGTVAASDAFAIALMNNAANVAAVSSIMLLLTIVFNLLLAGTTRFKNIFLSTHIVMYFCVGFTVMYMMCTTNGYSDLALDKQGLLAVLIGAGLISIYTTLAPSLTTKVTYELTKDKNMNLCHHGLFCFALAQGVGKVCGKIRHGRYTSTEEMRLPRWMSILKNSNVTIVLVMTLLFAVVFIAAYVKNPDGAHQEIVSGPTGVTSLGVAFIIDAFMFTAGLLVLIEGITMMVNELRDCIRGISQRFITGARMSVDASLVLKTQPIAVMLGFLASFLGAICTMGISFAFHALDDKLFSNIILPSVVVFFFLGGTAGIFGNMRGGLLGCLMAGFFVGLIVSLLPILLIATFNTLTGATAQTPWYMTQDFSWNNPGHFDPQQSAVALNSYGESDYVLIPMFGWLMYAGTHFANGGITKEHINPMAFIMLAVIVITWSILILDGQLKIRRERKTNPLMFYNHKLQNINDAQKYYDEVHTEKLKYVEGSRTALSAKKTNYSQDEYQRKLNKLKSQKQRIDSQYSKRKRKTAERLKKLKSKK